MHHDDRRRPCLFVGCRAIDLDHAPGRDLGCGRFWLCSDHAGARWSPSLGTFVLGAV